MISRSNSTWFRLTEPVGICCYEGTSWDHYPGTRQPVDQESEPEVLANSWRRYNSSRVRDLWIFVEVNVGDPHQTVACMSWLAQANHIFAQLQRTSHFEDFVYPNYIQFFLRCLPNTHNPHEREGYLFVCPSEDFQTGLHSFQWPDCPAYWSLDPSGATRLSTEDARILGLPILHIQTKMYGFFWDESVYDGLRRFHRGKEFDPAGQEAAIHLGYPLYELRSDVMAPLPCVDWENCDFNDSGRCRELGHYL
ncbi:hypothetical protein B0H14DRAFT_1335747 [Mycena olivaceomarginata]|nr:hypothetical protein B0H14DRAFT_1335747 [Mycena olivaceomarginata]